MNFKVLIVIAILFTSSNLVFARGCNSTLECESLETCTAGQCVGECITDLECKFLDHCIGGVCVGQNPECNSSIDCSFNMSCVDGMCRGNTFLESILNQNLN